MITKFILWFWYGLGVPALLTYWFSRLLIHLSNPMDFIMAVITAMTAILKLAVTWSEKGEGIKNKVRQKWNKYFNKAKYQRDNRDDTEDYLK